MANPSAEQVIGLARDLIRAESGSDVPTVADSFMLAALSDANLEWLRSFRRGAGNSPVSQALETGFDLASDTAINDAAGTTTATVTVTVDSTTGYDSSGAAVIWDDGVPDVFYYTGVTATTFTGVTGLAFSHADNDAIQPLYKLPSNFRSFRRSQGYGDGVSLNGDGLTFTEGPPESGHFSLRDDGTSKYLWLPRGSTGDCGVLFDKTGTTIDSTDDLVDVPEEYRFFLVWRLVHSALFGRGDYPILGLAKQESDRIRLEALKDRNVGRRVRVRPLSMTGNRNYRLPDIDDE